MSAANSKSDAKALILIIANSFEEELDTDSAATIITKAAHLSIMDYLEIFSELEEAGFVYTSEADGVRYCSVTELGSEMAETLRDSFRFIDVDKILEVARAEYERIVEGREYKSSLRRTEGGWYLDFSYSLYGFQRLAFSAFYDNLDTAEKALHRLERNPVGFHTYITAFTNSDLPFPQ